MAEPQIQSANSGLSFMNDRISFLYIKVSIKPFPNHPVEVMIVFMY